MNFCYLTEKMQKTPEEVFDVLSSYKDNYFDLNIHRWVERKTNGSIRVKKRSSDEHHVIHNKLAIENWDEYTNQMTILSWEGLVEYFNEPHEVYHIVHAAFLLDLSERNCIPINNDFTEMILSKRLQHRLFDVNYVFMKNFNRKTYMESVHKTILKDLNVGFYKDAFVRV